MNLQYSDRDFCGFELIVTGSKVALDYIWSALSLKAPITTASGDILIFFFSSPEHEVLMVSYCGQSMSVVRRPSSVVRRQQLL